MNLAQLLHHVSKALKPLADELAKAEKLAGPEAQLRALGILLDRHSKADQLKERDREVLSALWQVYRRLGRPVERDKLIREDARIAQCDWSTVYRSLRRLRDEYGYVRMIGKNWEPVFDPDQQGLEIVEIKQEPPRSVVRIAA